VALRFRVGFNLGGRMAPSGPGLASIRRGVGVAAVLFLLGCAVVFYRAAPSFPTSGSSPGTTAHSPASPTATGVGTRSATPGGPQSSARPSQASDPGPSTSTTTPGAGDSSGSGSAEQKTIQLNDSAYSAKPFQTVRIQGTYHGGADTFLRVERWEVGKWLAFPLATRTDRSGQFTAYVELGELGSHRLRILDPNSGLASKPFVLVITR
jgi:hypothetical protein